MTGASRWPSLADDKFLPMTAAPQMSPLRLVVCGTDTDVGKTVVSALLVQGLGAR